MDPLKRSHIECDLLVLGFGLLFWRFRSYFFKSMEAKDKKQFPTDKSSSNTSTYPDVNDLSSLQERMRADALSMTQIHGAQLLLLIKLPGREAEVYYSPEAKEVAVHLGKHWGQSIRLYRSEETHNPTDKNVSIVSLLNGLKLEELRNLFRIITDTMTKDDAKKMKFAVDPNPFHIERGAWAHFRTGNLELVNPAWLRFCLRKDASSITFGGESFKKPAEKKKIAHFMRPDYLVSCFVCHFVSLMNVVYT